MGGYMIWSLPKTKSKMRWITTNWKSGSLAATGKMLSLRNGVSERTVMRRNFTAYKGFFTLRGLHVL